MTAEEILKGRIRDLANRAYQQNIYTYTNFLSSSDMEVFYALCPTLSFVDFQIYGEDQGCDRLMIGFGSEASTGYVSEFPVALIKISPLLDKFSEELDHRDFLGALMNLGIEREMLGDILVRSSKISGKKNSAYLFCVSGISAYILENLTKVRHTNVKAELCTEENLPEITPVREEIQLIAASARIDAVIASITKLSRSQVIALFREKKISLNHRTFENNSYLLKPSDTISIRGYGKYTFIRQGGTTKKGRLYITLEKYR